MKIEDFLETWHHFLEFTIVFAIVLLPVIYFVYLIRYGTLSTYKLKYEYVLRYRVRVLKIINIVIALIIFAIANLYNRGEDNQRLIHFIVLFSVGIVVGVAYLYFMFMYLNVYYGKRLSSVLDRLRYAQRVNPKTGNKMKLLSEEEEDVYLDEGMQAEEDIFSIDYDVWIDKESGDVHIERYEGGAVASECGSCGFQTLRLIKEEVVQSESGPKNVLQYYTCSYCNTDLEKVVRAKEGSPGLAFSSVTGRNTIENISLTLSIKGQGLEVFDFQTLEQARNFISKYEAQNGKEDEDSQDIDGNSYDSTSDDNNS